MKLLETDYRPPPEDKARIKILSDMFKVSGDGVFATLQGEGLTTKEGGTAGLPVVFLRLHFCNLTCGFPTGWQCDTRYTWNPRMEEFWKEPRDWSINQTAVNIRQAWRQHQPQTPLPPRCHHPHCPIAKILVKICCNRSCRT